jgi:hypothetical protein
MTADDRPELCPACELVLAAWVRREPDPEPAESPCVVCDSPDCGHHGG